MLFIGVLDATKQFEIQLVGFVLEGLLCRLLELFEDLEPVLRHQLNTVLLRHVSDVALLLRHDEAEG